MESGARAPRASRGLDPRAPTAGSPPQVVLFHSDRAVRARAALLEIRRLRGRDTLGKPNATAPYSSPTSARRRACVRCAEPWLGAMGCGPGSGALLHVHAPSVSSLSVHTVCARGTIVHDRPALSDATGRGRSTPLQRCRRDCQEDSCGGQGARSSAACTMP